MRHRKRALRRGASSSFRPRRTRRIWIPERKLLAGEHLQTQPRAHRDRRGTVLDLASAYVHRAHRSRWWSAQLTCSSGADGAIVGRPAPGDNDDVTVCSTRDQYHTLILMKTTGATQLISEIR